MYEKQFSIEDVPSGQDNYYELKFIPTGTLTRLTVTQISGTAAGFEFDLYTSKLVGEGPLSDTASEPYRIMPKQTPSGAILQLAGTAAMFAFQNVDGGPTNRPRLLHCRIKPAGTGDKDFNIVLAATDPTRRS